MSERSQRRLTLGRALTWTGIGAAVMYLLDPIGGRRRRALLRDKAAHAAATSGEAVQKTSRDLSNRSRGVVMRGRAALNRQGQQSPSRRRARFELFQQNWSPTARLLTSTGGGALTLMGLRMGGVAGLGLALGGIALALRGLTNVDFKRMTGFGAGPRAVDLQKTIQISAALSDVFELWSNYENFPRFMSHVREVRDLGESRSRWVVEGPGNVPVEWEAELTEFVPDQTIAWITVPGALVEHAGVVRFDPEADGTRVHIQLSYNPPAGAIGHALATLLGSDPKRQMDDDLLRMKTFIETGQPPHDAEERAERSSEVSMSESFPR